MFPKHKKLIKAFTLLEVLVTIVVIAITATALLGLYTSVIGRSADPVIQQQAIAIAEAYLEEIQLQSFEDPEVVETNGPEEGSRSEYDDVQDYDGITNAAIEDQNGAAITQLGAYTVTVSVGFEALDSITQASNNALRIDVSVDHPAIDPITLSGFRTNY